MSLASALASDAYLVSSCETTERIAVVEQEAAARAQQLRRLLGTTHAHAHNNNSSSNNNNNNNTTASGLATPLGCERDSILRQVSDLKLENAGLRRKLAEAAAREISAKHASSPQRASASAGGGGGVGVGGAAAGGGVDYMLLYSAAASDPAALREALTLRQLSLWAELRLTSALLRGLPEQQAEVQVQQQQQQQQQGFSPSPRRLPSVSPGGSPGGRHPAQLHLTRRQLVATEAKRLKELSMLAAEVT